MRMNFSYDAEFGAYTPEAYERLLLEAIAGDATLFLRRDEVEIRTTPITEEIAEHVDAAAAFVGEIEIIRGIIHLRLLTRGGLEPLHGRDRRARAQLPHPLGEDGVTARVAESAQFLVDALRGDVGIARQQVGDRCVIGVELTGAPGHVLLRFGHWGTVTCPFDAL